MDKLRLKSGVGAVIYKDLRGFIKQVDELGALRRINGADPKFELGGITEVAAGTPECPALLFDRIKGYAPGFRVFTNATTTPQRAALALGIDPSLKPLDALKAWMQKRQNARRRTSRSRWRKRRSWKTPCAGANVDLTKLPAPTGTARTAGRSSARARSSSCAIRTAAGSTPRSTACRCTARTSVTIQFDHPGRHGAIIAKKYWDKGKSCPVAVVNGEDPALFIAGFEYLPDGQSEYDFAGAIKGAPLEMFAGPLTGLPLPAQAESILEGELLPPEQDHAAGRPVRRVHRLLRRRRAALPGDAGRRDPSPRRSDPARLAADEAAALSFRPAVPRRLDLEQSGDGRRHRRGRRLAARRATDDRGGAEAALRRPRQARRR